MVAGARVSHYPAVVSFTRGVLPCSTANHPCAASVHLRGPDVVGVRHIEPELGAICLLQRLRLHVEH